MRTTDKPVRQSVTLAPGVAKRVRSLARSRGASTSRTIAALVEAGLEAADRERQNFLEIAERLAQSSDPDEQRRLKAELARLTFGD